MPEIFQGLRSPDKGGCYLYSRHFNPTIDVLARYLAAMEGTEYAVCTASGMAAISTVEYGDPVADAELLEQLSPINKVDRVVAPTIVLHGANDTNVPVVEAEQVVQSLEERGVPVEYVLFPDEGHGWRKTENRIASDVAIVKWFVEHL